MNITYYPFPPFKIDAGKNLFKIFLGVIPETLR
ncbi:CRISPR type II-A/NMEMI-associated protein Csn2 [Lactiplantibacillus plantarum]|nr:CRISPR type II-A/NMEMI-associated protein Csn2 [Lactiplantibacillus plantarum]